ncbi:MAG TPA: DegT/DnrJ/EryC1/StrS family aminotransferase [Thermoanaerobaculia bacterium]|jgi:perosamine synthetase|nr:DegT/DnrJ/EryC1/StrS family aminotransferase [Thermoanaerobaculia bacterium]
MKAIHAYPRPPLATLRRAPSPAMRDALDQTPHLTRFSRDALHLVFSALGAPRGTPVWCPSFHCGMEVRAAAEAGFTPRFYRLHGDLTVDEQHLAQCLGEAAGPVLLIHYFGFAQPGTARIAALCRANGVPLIEDCSHAFLSRFEGRAIGAIGTAATFSLYKTFGTSDGGALRADRALLDAAAIESHRRPRVAWSEQWGSIRRRWRDRPPLARAEETIHARFLRRNDTAWRRIFEDPWHAGSGISKLSLALIERHDPDLLVARRRRNYERLDALLRDAAGYRSVALSLPDESCPLYLPIFIRKRTDAFVKLFAARVEPFIFGMFHYPAMPVDAFPESRTMRDEILCLPIHQDLGDADIDRVASLVRPLLRPTR